MHLFRAQSDSQNQPAHRIYTAVALSRPLLQDQDRELFHLIQRNKYRKSNKMKRQRNLFQMTEQEGWVGNRTHQPGLRLGGPLKPFCVHNFPGLVCENSQLERWTSFYLFSVVHKLALCVSLCLQWVFSSSSALNSLLVLVFNGIQASRPCWVSLVLWDRWDRNKSLRQPSKVSECWTYISVFPFFSLRVFLIMCWTGRKGSNRWMHASPCLPLYIQHLGMLGLVNCRYQGKQKPVPYKEPKRWNVLLWCTSLVRSCIRGIFPTHFVLSWE